MQIVRFSSFADTEYIFKQKLAGHDVRYIPEPLTRETAAQAADAEAISVFVDCDVSKPVLDALPKLRLIVSESSGIDHIDAAAAGERGIVVKNVPGYGAHAVAEFAFALMLMVSRRLYSAASAVREQGAYDIRATRGFDLHGKTLGVVGTGRIGKQVIAIGTGFGMNMLAYDVHPDVEHAAKSGYEYTDLKTLVSRSDIITLHVPYTNDSHHLIDADMFSSMKEGAVLINTARGELVDTAALVGALKAGRLSGAGLDVLEEERSLKSEASIIKNPEAATAMRALLADHILMELPNVVVTPHIAFHSKEADEDRVSRAVDEIISFANSAR